MFGVCAILAGWLLNSGCNGISQADCIVIVDNPSGGGAAFRASDEVGGYGGAGDSADGGADAGAGGD